MQWNWMVFVLYQKCFRLKFRLKFINLKILDRLIEQKHKSIVSVIRQYKNRGEILGGKFIRLQEWSMK